MDPPVYLKISNVRFIKPLCPRNPVVTELLFGERILHSFPDTLYGNPQTGTAITKIFYFLAEDSKILSRGFSTVRESIFATTSTNL